MIYDKLKKAVIICIRHRNCMITIYVALIQSLQPAVAVKVLCFDEVHVDSTVILLSQTAISNNNTFSVDTAGYKSCVLVA
jgi:hypothetical protein